MLTLFKILISCLSCVLATLTLRYILHVFQQNSYFLSEQYSWFKNNWNKTVCLLIAALINILAIKTSNIAIIFIAVLFTSFVIYNFNFLRIHRQKKPFVYTNRIKRLIVSDIILSIVFLSEGYALTDFDGLIISCLMLPIIQIILVPIASLLNSPIEKTINKKLIKEAKDIIQKHTTLKVIGITGSWGKTSTKYYLQHILQDSFEVLITPGNYNTTLGVVKTIREYLKPTHEIFICEMGARHIGDIKEICDIVHPNCGIITAIGKQHLETFGDIETIISTKFELSESLDGNGFICVNIDDDNIRENIDEQKHFITYGFSSNANYQITDIETNNNSTNFVISTPNNCKCKYSTKLLGKHNIVNLAAAIAIAHQLGIPLENMKVPIRRLRAVEHRLSTRKIGNITIIDDAYNSNPNGAKAALDVLKTYPGHKILITPGMIELGNEQNILNSKFAKYAADICDDIFIVGEHNKKSLLTGLTQADFSPKHIYFSSSFDKALTNAKAINSQEDKIILIENDLGDNY